MRSNTFLTLQNERDPRSTLEAIMGLIVQSERENPIEAHLRLRFAKSMGSAGRNWGESHGEIEDIRLQHGDLDPGIFLEFTHDEYSRGCHMGTSRYKQFIPDQMIERYERWQFADEGHATDDGRPLLSYQVFTEVLRAYTLERIYTMTRDYKAEQAELTKQQEAAYATAEADERALYAQLREKYGDEA